MEGALERPVAIINGLSNANKHCVLSAAATAPEYLDGSLAGDYGWDPLGLGSQKDRLNYFRQAELQNGRWASKSANSLT